MRTSKIYAKSTLIASQRFEPFCCVGTATNFKIWNKISTIT